MQPDRGVGITPALNIDDGTLPASEKVQRSKPFNYAAHGKPVPAGGDPAWRALRSRILGPRVAWRAIGFARWGSSDLVWVGRVPPGSFGDCLGGQSVQLHGRYRRTSSLGGDLHCAGRSTVEPVDGG